MSETDQNPLTTEPITLDLVRQIAHEAARCYLVVMRPDDDFTPARHADPCFDDAQEAAEWAAIRKTFAHAEDYGYRLSPPEAYNAACRKRESLARDEQEPLPDIVGWTDLPPWDRMWWRVFTAVAAALLGAK